MESESKKVDIAEVFEKLDRFFAGARWNDLYDLKEVLKKDELAVLASALKADDQRRIFVHKHSQFAYNICGHDKESGCHFGMPRDCPHERTE